MTRVQSRIEIDAPMAAVWDVLTDTSYIVKLFRDAVFVEIDPPGRSAMGQKYHIVGKAGRRRVEFFIEVAKIVPGTEIMTVQRSGGLFKTFTQHTILSSRSGRTESMTSFEYEISLGYLGKALNIVLVERLVRDNLAAYSGTLKELSELLPLPAQSETPQLS